MRAPCEVADVVRLARAVVCDFDGTLVDSNAIKWRAFEVCLSKFPERRAEILAYCRGHPHTPRWEKFRHVYEEIIGQPYTPDTARRLQERFDAATTRQIVAAPEIPGATRFLRAIRRTHIVAVVSTTPHDVLVRILRERGWGDIFEHVRGAPVDKRAWLQAFREEQGLGEADVVVFGDTAEDERAAVGAGCTFVGVAREPVDLESRYRVVDFSQLVLDAPSVA